MLILYQFPISHYCEKARWALDYKGLDYEVKNLLPGLHVLKTKKLAPRTSVPILEDDDEVIQGSNHIITYLDEKFPERSLTPEDDRLREEALEWEKYVDSEIGIHVRRCSYYVLLDYPNIVIPFLTHNGPWYGKLFLRVMYPRLRNTMREAMNINAETARKSLEHLSAAIDRVYGHLQDHEFLVGDRFTRADLAAASLLAPLCKPKKYGLDWPERYPDELEVLIDGFGNKLDWVKKVYDAYR